MSKQTLAVAHATSHQKHSPEQQEEASLHTKPKGNPVTIFALQGDFISVSHKTPSFADITKCILG